MNPGQILHPLEGAVGLAVGHDAGRQDRADAGHLLQGVHTGLVYVDPGCPGLLLTLLPAAAP